MIKLLPVLAATALTACSQQPQQNGDTAATANNAAAERPTNHCIPPTLAMDGGQTFDQGSALLDETRTSFAAAFERACGKGLLKDRTLIDAKAADQERMFLVNAPDANVASIYLSDIDGSRMVLEYPFLTTDGKSQVPSADELEEAIYCAVIGATPEEQESTGRCLVD